MGFGEGGVLIMLINIVIVSLCVCVCLWLCVYSLSVPWSAVMTSTPGPRCTSPPCWRWLCMGNWNTTLTLWEHCCWSWWRNMSTARILNSCCAGEWGAALCWCSVDNCCSQIWDKTTTAKFDIQEVLYCKEFTDDFSYASRVFLRMVVLVSWWPTVSRLIPKVKIHLQYNSLLKPSWLCSIVAKNCGQISFKLFDPVLMDHNTKCSVFNVQLQYNLADRMLGFHSGCPWPTPNIEAVFRHLLHLQTLFYSQNTV